MKRLAIVLAAALALPVIAGVDDLPFAPGEKLIYSVSYGDTKAGICVMKVVKQVTYQGRLCYKLVMELRSSTAFSDFFYVKDDIESLFDVELLATRRYEKHLIEGDYAADEVLYYDQEKHTITREGDVREGIVASGCDALAAFYHVRAQDIQVDGELSFPYADATRNEVVRVKVMRKETVTVPAGTFEAFKIELRPMDGTPGGGTYFVDTKTRAQVRPAQASSRTTMRGDSSASVMPGRRRSS